MGWDYERKNNLLLRESAAPARAHSPHLSMSPAFYAKGDSNRPPALLGANQNPSPPSSHRKVMAVSLLFLSCCPFDSCFLPLALPGPASWLVPPPSGTTIPSTRRPRLLAPHSQRHSRCVEPPRPPGWAAGPSGLALLWLDGEDPPPTSFPLPPRRDVGAGRGHEPVCGGVGHPKKKECIYGFFFCVM